MEISHRPLSGVKAGEKVRLVYIDAGHGLRGRLVAMGLVPGTILTVINNNRPGPFVISVKNTKVMLGRGMANKIIVSDTEVQNK
jgi:ferrous iron transport protein A